MEPEITLPSPNAASLWEEARLNFLVTARNGLWPIQRRIDEYAALYASHLPALLNRDDTATQNQLYETILDRITPRPTPLTAESNPKLFAVLSAQCTELNRMHALPNTLPRVVAVEGLMKNMGTPMAYGMEGDILYVDSSVAQSIEQGAPASEATLAHELGHRYDTNPEQIALYAQVAAYRQYRQPIPDELQDKLRASEAAADFVSAQLTGASTAYDSLYHDACEPYSFAEYTRRVLNEPVDAPLRDGFLKLPPDRQEALKRDFDALPQEKKRELLDAAIRNEYNAPNPRDPHPTLEDRLDLIAALKLHPELLQATHIRFDGQANIIEVEANGRRYTPEQVAAINRDGDVAGGLVH